MEGAVGLYAISGSASGIGAATRARLERAGHAVVGIDLHNAEIIADLSTPQGRAAAVEAVLDRSQGHLDGLLTAAGVGPPFSAEKMVSINWFGTEALLRGLRVALANSRRGQVVAISSNSTTTMPDLPADLIDACLALDEPLARSLANKHGDGNTYGASKTAVARYVRRHAPTADWAGSGIRLNAIAPGATLTPLLQAGLDSEEYGPAIKAFPVPTGDFGDPDEIAAWIEHMLIGDGCRFMCGTLLFVDGGTDAMVRADAWPTSFAMPTGSQFGFD
jgi:NAD(P)-dependent dehydrogenase (short-subunit alcohol dehydrogenase family)